MPLIQRNLFPSRPPLKRNDGPSILRQSSDQQQNTTTITNPNLSLYHSKYNNKSSDSSTKSSNNNGNNKENGKLMKKDAKKLKKSQSASMISLMAINNIQQQQPQQQNGRNNSSSNNKSNNHRSLTNYDSQDSFNSSDASSSDPNSLCSSSSSVDNMISRRRILSRSRDALNTTSTSDDYSSSGFIQPPQDEDVWFNKAKLISDHVEEIVSKWNQIDDEIWAKIICMERHRRVAKAYARTPILTINGYEAGFDGHRIGLNGFKNPMRDKKTADIKKKIDDGIKLRMDENGSLLVKRLTDTDVFLVSFDKMDNICSEKIEQRKSVILFDMKQYQNELLRELKSPTPNPRVLEKKCFCFVSFATVADELLNTPVWCIVINLVALEMLVKLLPNRIFEDNFYSLPLSLSSKSTGGYLHSSPVPPKLPPRDLNNKKPPLTLPEPDYGEDDEPVIPTKPNMVVDDPYYHGLSAHVPKFAYSGRMPNQNRVHPPIIRKAMNKKTFWPNPLSFPAQFQQRPFTTSHTNLLHDIGGGYFRGGAGVGGMIPANQFLPPNGYATTDGTRLCHSTFDPMTIPMPPCFSRTNFNSLDHQPMNNANNNNNSNNNSNNMVNDNNEIYGVNPSLLRKNVSSKFHIRSSSSPSLKNIFSRKKTTNSNNNKNKTNNNNNDKDYNNNPRMP